MTYTIDQIQEYIRIRLPHDKVVADHDSTGHYYIVDGERYPSVTGKLQILKDESLINYKKNQVIQWVFRNFKTLTDENIMDKLGEAERVPEDILFDASDIGTQIHDTRERIFQEWIETGVRPVRFTDKIDPAMPDIRLKSAMRALEKFCIEREYTPIATELYVYSHELKVAGTLDDLGMMNVVLDKGDPECEHDYYSRGKNRVCFSCTRKVRPTFVLMDLKSSNQLKDHYFFQVSLYFEMLRKIIGIAPEMCFILKLSKEDGTYKIEDLKHPGKLVQYAKYMLKTNDAIAYIKSLRKDNQKKVAEQIEL